MTRSTLDTGICSSHVDEECDHEWRYEMPEWDVGFCGFKECKLCGKTEALEPGDGEFEEYE